MNRIALRAQRGSRPQGPICQICQFSNSAPPRLALPVARLAASPVSTSSSNFPRHSTSHSVRSPVYLPHVSSRRFASKASSSQSVIRDIAQEASTLHQSDKVPSNEAVVELLGKCQKIAESIVSRKQEKVSGSSATEENNVISSLLHMEEKRGATADPRLADSISRIATELLKDEKVFISPEALEHYTKIQTLLRRAEHFPEIFHLYANKPVPEENSSPVKYHKTNPKSVNSAVPAELADMALDIAISQKNLSLVLAIIDNTFCAPAFYRAKIFRKAGVPLAGLAGAPAACYALASLAASLQNSMDPSTATGIAFAASLAYVGGVSSMGILAITTANDQMERVVWLPGVPLRHRWLREEERAAMDKVAIAWGFKDPWMRGEEVGEEWESLREFIGMRGMILDKTDLMPGME
ncbi:uncharacterized protein N7459_007181 [Penicillium hispanicum]|uniref:uncharacterized protein n=1 Tax=Penicillium hispanicum TaxID=1080232 RepID=UPI0025421B70|nr:uncharacterized protein N7459_007181 [Penicillium hispanicum]KAJ5578217.1 hypothetical protein N7459_007181 [Penicillium hispanicum]